MGVKRFTAASPIALVAALAIALPLPALADTEVDDKRDTPIETATADNGNPDDVTITNDGEIEVDLEGAAATLNSDNFLINNGIITNSSLENAIGVLIQGGFEGGFTNNGELNVLSDDIQDPDDNDLLGRDKVGVLVQGPGAFTGDIIFGEDSDFTFRGIDSTGLRLQTEVIGNVQVGGVFVGFGPNAKGIHVAESVDGLVQLSPGAILRVGGGNSVALQTDAPISGGLFIDSFISASAGAVEQDDGTLGDAAAADAAVRIGADVLGGIHVRSISGAQTSLGSLFGEGALYGLRISPELSLNPNGDILLGAVDDQEDETNFGLLIEGAIAQSALEIGAPGAAISIDGNGGTVTIEGGIGLNGDIASATLEGEAVGLDLGSGASTPRVVLQASIRADARDVNGGDDATVEEMAGADAIGIRIAADAMMPRLEVLGDIRVTAIEPGSAFGVLDHSGTLTDVEIGPNGLIRARVLEQSDDDDDVISPGSLAIALDLRNANSGITIMNEGIVEGDVVLGDFDDTWSQTGELFDVPGGGLVERASAFAVGDLDFGGGANTLEINEFTNVTGSVFATGGTLDVMVAEDGSLFHRSTTGSFVRDVTVADGGGLLFRIDEDTDQSQPLVTASGIATIEDGAVVDVQLTTFLPDDAQFILLDAALLNADPSTFGSEFTSPFIYDTEIVIDGTNPNRLVYNVAPKDPIDLGLTPDLIPAFDEVFAAFGRDAELGTAVLAIEDQDEFLDAYTQLVPDRSPGIRSFILGTTNAANGPLASRLDTTRAMQVKGKRFWSNVDGFFNILDSNGIGADTNVEGYTATIGFDWPILGANAVGVSGTLGVGEVYKEETADSEVLAHTFQANVYGTWSRKGAFLDVIAGGGYNVFDSERTIRIGLLERTASDSWNGYHYNTAFRAGYRHSFDRLVLGSFGGMSYTRLEEDGHTESGGGSGVDLVFDERTTQSTQAFAGLTVSYFFDYDRGLIAPQFRATYVAELDDDPVETRASFRDGSASFVIPAEVDSNYGAIGVGVQMMFLEAELQFDYDFTLSEDTLGSRGGATLRVPF